jgi:TctA family transporter
MTRRKAQV